MTDVIGEAWYRLRPDTSTFGLEAKAGVQSALAGLTPAAIGGTLFRSVGITSGLTAIALGAREAIGGAADLEQQLDILQQVGQATDEQMKEVGDQAKRLGADLTLPGISAGDSAAAMLELVKGGLDVQETIDGARGALQLATAANLGYAESAQIIARSLTTFEAPGTEAVHVADLLAGAANAATGEVADMALALQQSGAVAHQAGLSLDDTVTAISLLAKNGILGSDAGTSLRTTLLRLIPQSKEAAEIVEALGIATGDAAGNIRPLRDIFEDYRLALARLDPVTRQAALTQIFGTDAIRAAAVFANEGAEGFDTMSEAVTRQGVAAETAAARTEGLKGAAGGLASNAETLATNLGELAVPALTDFADAASVAVGGVNNLVTAIEDLADEQPRVADFFGALEEGLKRTVIPFNPVDALVEGIPGLRELKAAAEIAVTGLRDVRDEAAVPVNFSAVDALTGGGGLMPEGLFARDRIEARRAGESIGKELGAGVADGVVSAEQEAVNAARATLREVLAAGKDAVAEAIRQGAEAVRLSAVDARSNLISIGQSLAADALQLLEEGPLARRIDALRLQLDRSQAGNERRRLTQGLRDAERALRDAQAQAQTAGPLTRAQTRARARFLEPFQRDIGDAKAALSEFTIEGVIGQLEKQAAEQKRVVQQGIADLIVQFTTGGLTLSGLNTQTASLLARNGVEPYGVAGARLGLAFKTKFSLELDALRRQAIEIFTGLSVPEVGLEPTVVSPTATKAEQAKQIQQAREDAAAREKAARDASVRAQNALRRSLDDDTDATKDLAAAIRAFKVTGGKKPSVAAGPGSSGDRSSGRTP